MFFLYTFFSVSGCSLSASTTKKTLVSSLIRKAEKKYFQLSTKGSRPKKPHSCEHVRLGLPPPHNKKIHFLAEKPPPPTSLTDMSAKNVSLVGQQKGKLLSKRSNNYPCPIPNFHHKKYKTY